MFTKEKRGNTFNGILLVALFSMSAFFVSEFGIIKNLSLSPLIIGIIMGMFYANSLRNHLPETWVPGILFCSKSLLRYAIILYGFQLNYQSVIAVGWGGIVVDALIVIITLFLGLILGKIFKLDRDISLLTSVGSAICGAAAILGTEPLLNSKPYKTAVAVSTVVIFGTIAMFLYPFLYHNNLLNLNAQEVGIFTGSTLHEVAHTVGAAKSMGNEIAGTAIIVKMIRVIMLAPFLLILGVIISKTGDNNESGNGKSKNKITIPWFAFGFLLVIAFNSLDLLPLHWVDTINYIDIFMLTMAMTALGIETSFDKFKKAGPKPFLMAFILFIWLIFGGYYLTKIIVPFLA